MAWAKAEPSVLALIQIGSRVRPLDEFGAADCLSDWDFQVVTSDPARFERRESYHDAFGVPLALAARGGRLGSARKITVLLADGEIDIVVIPLKQIEDVWNRVTAGDYNHDFPIMSALEDMYLVIIGGFNIIKGNVNVSALYAFVRSNVMAPRLSVAEIIQIAEGFVCDYVSTSRKIMRGEYLAAQRWLHHQLAEANFRLAHEYRKRSGLPSFPDARRLELLLDDSARAALEVRAVPSRESLECALQKSAETCRSLMQSLVGGSWSWPALPSYLGRE